MLIAIVLAWRDLPVVLRRGVVIGAAGLIVSIAGLRTGWIALDWFVVPFALFASLAAGPALFAIARRGGRAITVVLAVCGIFLVIAGALPAIAPGLLQRVAARGVEFLQQRGHLHQPPAVYAARFAAYLAAAKWTALRRAFLPGLCWIAFAAGLRTRRVAIVSIAALAELAFFGYGFIPSIRTDEIAPQPALVGSIDPHWFVAASSDAFPANLGTLYKIRQIDSYDVLTSESRTEQLQRAGYGPFLHAFIEPHREQLAALGVRYWIDARGVTEIANAPRPAPPQTSPPEGVVAGAVVSAVGALLALVQCAGAFRTRNPQPARARDTAREAEEAAVAAPSGDEAPRR